MSHPDFAMAGFYDHEHEAGRRAPDWGGDELFAAAPRRRRFEPAPDPYAEPVPAGRRTVTVTGHPGPLAVSPRRGLDAGPRRPGRTLDERFAHRPERIVAWSFGMGLLLILLAVLTAQ